MRDWFPTYPSIGKLSDRKEILTVKKVRAKEKLHGSNFRVGIENGDISVEQLVYGTRERDLGFAGSADCLGFFDNKPVNWFTSQPEVLRSLIGIIGRLGLRHVTLFGEVCGSSIQNGVLYLKRHEVMFRAFDICVGGEFLSDDDLTAICHDAGIPTVPEIWSGEPSKDAFDALLEQPSTEAAKNGIADGCNISEGVIIRADPFIRDRRKNWLVIKHKSKKFDECVREGLAQDRLRLGPTVAFARMVVTPGRLMNVRGHLRDNGAVFAGVPQDMSILGPAVLADVHKECQDDWDALVEREGFTDREVHKAVWAQLNPAYAALLAMESQQPVSSEQ